MGWPSALFLALWIARWQAASGSLTQSACRASPDAQSGCPAEGCWLLAAGYWLLAVGCWLGKRLPAWSRRRRRLRRSRSRNPSSSDPAFFQIFQWPPAPHLSGRSRSLLILVRKRIPFREASLENPRPEENQRPWTSAPTWSPSCL